MIVRAQRAGDEAPPSGYGLTLSAPLRRALWWNIGMYPAPDVLEEVGRVTIAGSRLDIEMGMVWHHLDRTIDLNRARRTSGAAQCRHLRVLAETRLVGELRNQVLAVVDAAEGARRRRNEIVHQDWLLRGPDATRSVAELACVNPANMPKYLEEWGRDSRASQDWRRVPSDSTNVVEGQTVEELRDVERALAEVTTVVSGPTFAVASSRETGRPPGYIDGR
ncbi:hypothetical protein [Pedococcus sp. 5OH_020]|uniref:hypothetical protein n=1 Tax=Pedococcus sp. 5OH_020 TaxID=2989814 RepID=UPI0022E9CCB0|nr:hypothetical protein [Pedococcus sp. 5OH_020]